jgi:hypothetical protein
MSIAELTSATLPRHTGRSMQRRIKLARTQAYRVVRRRTKKAIRSLVRWQRSQYYLATAVRDVRKHAARNEDIVLGSMIIALIVIFAFANTIARVVLQSFLTMSYLNDETGLSVVLLVLLFGGVLTTLGAWLAAWMSNMLSIAVMDGANRKRNKSLRSTMRGALRLASRTATSWFLLLAVVTGPMMAVGLLSLLYVTIFFEHTLTYMLSAVSFAGCFSVLWALYAFTTFGLMPQVALFDRDSTLIGAFARSRSLVLSRGRPFLLALYLAFAGFIATAYGVAMALRNVFGSASDVVLYGGVLVAVLGINLILTTLYRKRKLARK